jgi:hypothetical protein
MVISEKNKNRSTNWNKRLLLVAETIFLAQAFQYTNKHVKEPVALR